MSLQEIVLRAVRLPLIRPYVCCPIAPSPSLNRSLSRYVTAPAGSVG